jgi:hypothetical protein
VDVHDYTAYNYMLYSIETNNIKYNGIVVAHANKLVKAVLSILDENSKSNILLNYTVFE